MDIVFIEGLQIDALIGIYDWERRIRQPLVFDLEMQFDNTIPAASDAIADTLDYKAVSKRVMEFVGQSDFGLVETLAERVAAIVLDEFGVERVRLKLSKPGAVRGARAVGVMIERSRQPGAPRRAQAVPAAISAPGVPATAATAAMPEVEAVAFAAAVPRGGATPVTATADAPAPIEPEAVPAAEAVDDEQAAPDVAEVGAGEAVEPIASTEPVDSTGTAGTADPTERAEAVDMADSATTAEATHAAESTAREVAEAAIRDDANAHSPLEAALLAAVSGWHSPRPAPAGLDAALNALGEKGGRKPRKNGATPAAAVTADAASSAAAIPPEPHALPAVAEAPPVAPEPAATPADAPEASAPATAPARPRANFMQDLDEAPVRPVSVPAPVAPAEPPPLPVEDAAPPAGPPPLPVEDVAPPAEATAPLAPAVATSARVVPAFRTAPPPPPRPRNPASDLGRTTRPAYLSLGSNIEPEKNLRSALMALRARFGEVIVSPVYRMPAVGFEGPEFLNAAAIIDSDLDPFALTRWLHGIESAHGRMRSTVKNSSRTLDMDIIFFDDLVLDMPGGLQLPRPELRHAFVLKPLVDIAPGFIDPVRGVPLADVWAAHAERETKFSTVMI